MTAALAPHAPPAAEGEPRHRRLGQGFTAKGELNNSSKTPT